jgi:hypothetical protein
MPPRPLSVNIAARDVVIWSSVKKVASEAMVVPKNLSPYAHA